MKLSHEELILIEKNILLPLVRIVLEKDLKTIHSSPFKLKQPYIQLVDRALIQLSKELQMVKRESFSNGIKVIRGNKDVAFSEYDYFCRGYHGKRKYSNAELRNKTLRCLEGYLLYSSQ
ncbi:hypothetical protein ACJ2A9_16085 [Anaerobacillus sp. MEB173]|uniref:hypothetical protein n=1 Tax=Anaerobacillus sp. MEB173 TaxID=3383345 RepID=UPI003F9307DF